MHNGLISGLGILAGILAGIGTIQAAAALATVRRFTARRPAPATTLPPITVLKPLHGDEPLLEAALATFCAQAYPTFQLVFGVASATDPAAAIVERLRTRFPAVAIDLVINPRRHGANGKIGNLINMAPTARHDTIVIADSDMHVAPDYLAAIAATLEQPGTGLVTTIYAGRPATPGLVSALSTQFIDQAFLPGAVLARSLGRQDCLGATMALRRSTLDAIGGLETLADELADDAVLGHRVIAAGLTVGLARTIPLTTIPETTIAALFSHELRWARTIRSLVPAAFAASAIQYSLGWAILAIALTSFDPWITALALACWTTRAARDIALRRTLNLAGPARTWLLPARDLLSLAVIAAAYTGDRVHWRGQILIAPARTVWNPLKRLLLPGEGATLL